MVKLTMKQRRFVQKYCENHGNGVKAVYAAGYEVSNDNSAAATASRLLRNVKVKEQIDAFEAKMAEKAEKQTVYTRKMAVTEYKIALELAKNRKQAGAMCKAIAGIVKVCGLNKKPAPNPAYTKPMTREELEEALRELDEVEAKAKIIQMKVNEKYA